MAIITCKYNIFWVVLECLESDYRWHSDQGVTKNMLFLLHLTPSAFYIRNPHPDQQVLLKHTKHIQYMTTPPHTVSPVKFHLSLTLHSTFWTLWNTIHIFWNGTSVDRIPLHTQICITKKRNCACIYIDIQQLRISNFLKFKIIPPSILCFHPKSIN